MDIPKKQLIKIISECVVESIKPLSLELREHIEKHEELTLGIVKRHFMFVPIESKKTIDKMLKKAKDKDSVRYIG